MKKGLRLIPVVLFCCPDLIDYIKIFRYNREDNILTNNSITISSADYKNIFLDIAEKLFTRGLINGEEKIKLMNIINKDENLDKKYQKYRGERYV